jgi:hypothetical protein
MPVVGVFWVVIRLFLVKARVEVKVRVGRGSKPTGETGIHH